MSLSPWYVTAASESRSLTLPTNGMCTISREIIVLLLSIASYDIIYCISKWLPCSGVQGFSYILQEKYWRKSTNRKCLVQIFINALNLVATILSALVSVDACPHYFSPNTMYDGSFQSANLTVRLVHFHLKYPTRKAAIELLNRTRIVHIENAWSRPTADYHSRRWTLQLLSSSLCKRILKGS